MLEKSILKYGEMVKNGEITWKEAAELVNKEQMTDFTSEAVRKRYSGLKEKNTITPNGYFERDNTKKIEVKDVSVWVSPDFNKDDDRQVLQMCGYNPDEFELIKIRGGWHETGMKDEVANRIQYNFKIEVKPRTKDEMSLVDLLKAARETIAKEIKPMEVRIPEKKKRDKSKVVNMNALEAHIGKLVWSGDTNYANYDSKIAIECIKKIIKEVVVLQDMVNADRIIVPVGSDFLNGEGVEGSTTAGTTQMNDGRYKKLGKQALDIMVLLIETFKEHFNHIDLIMVEGNHDQVSSFWIYETLSRMYQDDKQCHFEDSLTPTQVYLFGESVLFFNHGAGGKARKKRRMGTYAYRYPEEWGQSKKRIAFENHEHHYEQNSKDENGITRYVLPAICPVDSWHDTECYVGADPAQAIHVIDKIDGVVMEKRVYFDDIFTKHTHRERSR